jgi:hypothetical protein
VIIAQACATMHATCMKTHTEADQDRLSRQLWAIIEEPPTDEDECAWRMDGVLYWWLTTMLDCCDQNVMTVMHVLTTALNNVGIQTATAAVRKESRKPTVQ